MLNIMNRKCLKVHLLSVRMIFINPRKKWYFKVFLVLSFGIFLYNCGISGKEVILRILFSLESFQMIANSEHLFLSLVNYRRIYSVHLKKSRFVEEVLF